MHYFNRLSMCEKALAEYLETKRLAFPRFYFISSADLLDILSKGSRPREVHSYGLEIYWTISSIANFIPKVREGILYALTDCVWQVTVHLSKLFDNMSNLEFAKNEMLDNPKTVVGMYSKEGEYVPFQASCCCYGPVRSQEESECDIKQ